MHARIKGIGYVVRGIDKLCKAGIDIGCGFETAAAPLSDGV
jgi:hypothetical protein